MKRYIKSAVADILQQHWTTKQAVAKDPNSSPRDLAYLATDPSRYTRACVAKNPNTPQEVLEMLARDPYYDVRASIMYNPNISNDLLERIQSSLNDRSDKMEFNFYISTGLTDELRVAVPEILDNILAQCNRTKYGETYRFDHDDDVGGSDVDFHYIVQCGPLESMDQAYDLIATPFMQAFEDTFDAFIDCDVETLLS